ncbi:MAG: hypothetical protein IPH20_21520 [Bacteroidales bacterium]|nr:hypothetical protein [Bacteroidales bacterium]
MFRLRWIEENFRSKISLVKFDAGRLMMDTAMFGPVSLKAEASGRGLDKNTIRAKIRADVSQVYLNGYNYHNLVVDGDITGRKFEGQINLMINMQPSTLTVGQPEPQREQYNLNLI